MHRLVLQAASVPSSRRLRLAGSRREEGGQCARRPESRRAAAGRASLSPERLYGRSISKLSIGIAKNGNL